MLCCAYMCVSVVAVCAGPCLSAPPRTHAAGEDTPTAPAQLVQPFSPQFWRLCHDSLLVLLRHGFSAPPGGFGGARACAGMAAAKRRTLQQRGWRVVVVGTAEVVAALRQGGGSGGSSAGQHQPDLDALQGLLESRLPAV